MTRMSIRSQLMLFWQTHLVSVNVNYGVETFHVTCGYMINCWYSVAYGCNNLEQIAWVLRAVGSTVLRISLDFVLQGVGVLSPNDSVAWWQVPVQKCFRVAVSFDLHLLGFLLPERQSIIGNLCVFSWCGKSDQRWCFFVNRRGFTHCIFLPNES